MYVLYVIKNYKCEEKQDSSILHIVMILNNRFSLEPIRTFLMDQILLGILYKYKVGNFIHYTKSIF